MIVGYHDWRRGAGAYGSPFVVDHLKMDIKPDFFTMVPTIACDAHGKDDGSGGEVEFLCTVELEQTKRGIRSFGRGFFCIWLDPRRDFTGRTLRLTSISAKNLRGRKLHGTSRDWQLEQTATRMCGCEEHVTSAVNSRVSWGAASGDKTVGNEWGNHHWVVDHTYLALLSCTALGGGIWR